MPQAKPRKNFRANGQINPWSMDRYRSCHTGYVDAHVLNHVAIVKYQRQFYLYHVHTGYGIAHELFSYAKFPQALVAAVAIDDIMDDNRFSAAKLMQVIEVLKNHG
jgi:hypothetical protein